MTNTTHTTEQDTTRSDQTPPPERSTVRPDLSPPPSSPEPDQDALAKGLDRLDSVKPY